MYIDKVSPEDVRKAAASVRRVAEYAEALASRDAVSAKEMEWAVTFVNLHGDLPKPPQNDVKPWNEHGKPQKVDPIVRSNTRSND